MSKKQIIFDDEARKSLEKGIELVAKTAAVTLGPAGRNVVIEKKFGGPQSVRDGVTVVKEIELEDPLENQGAQLIKQVAISTNDAAGDGTTTATVLASAIVREGMRNLAAGANPVDIKRGIDKAVKLVVEEFKAMSKDVKSSRDIEQVATISAANDNEVGKMIAEAMDKVGRDGVITVEESKKLIDTELEVVEGMQFDKGFISPYFITDSERMEAVLEEPFVLCVDKKVNIPQDLVPVLEAVARSGKPLLLLAEDIEGEALAALVINNLRQVLKCAAVKAPGFGDRRKAMLQDIATLVGSQVVTEETGMKLADTTIDQLGKARKAIISKDKTVLVALDSTKDAVEARIKQIDAQMSETDSDYDKEKLQERKAKLSGGVAVIKVGAPTEAELKDRKLRLEDALNATRAAVEEGIVPGGGTSQLKASKKLEARLSEFEGAERLGAEIITQSLRKLTYQIAKNAGISGEVVVERVLNEKDNIGFNAAVGQYVDMFEAGIVDPTKVSRTSLQNAASIAGQILLTDAVIVDIPEADAAAGMPAGAPGMGMGM